MASESVVTFKWLMGTAITLIAVSISTYFGMSHVFSLALEGKVDTKVYARQIAYYDQELAEMKEAQKTEGAQLNSLMINQAIAIQKLDEMIKNWERHLSVRSQSLKKVPMALPKKEVVEDFIFKYIAPKVAAEPKAVPLPKPFYYLSPPPDRDGTMIEKNLALVRERRSLRDMPNPAGCLYSREGKTTLFSGFGLSKLLCN